MDEQTNNPRAAWVTGGWQLMDLIDEFYERASAIAAAMEVGRKVIEDDKRETPQAANAASADDTGEQKSE